MYYNTASTAIHTQPCHEKNKQLLHYFKYRYTIAI